MNKIENKLNTKINIEEQLKELLPHLNRIYTTLLEEKQYTQYNSRKMGPLSVLITHTGDFIRSIKTGNTQDISYYYSQRKSMTGLLYGFYKDEG